MAIKVLVVDDSSFFRRRITEILNDGIEMKVVGTATNGREAIDKTQQLKPDVITMDYEMPFMDGITAVKNIMQATPTPILMFSSLTYEGARVTLDALDAGALDFLPKNFESVSRDAATAKQGLRDKVMALVRKKDRESNLELDSGASNLLDDGKGNGAAAPTKPAAPAKETSARPAPAPRPEPAKPAAPSPPTAPRSRPRTRMQRPQIVVIGASTGGPVALQGILKALPANFPSPILVVQHMPTAFTKAFAERLNKVCAITVREAEDGMPARPGEALIAPGGMQMLVTGNANSPKVRILESDDRLRYKPSVDVTFGSVAKLVQGRALAVVLTGMGADGREGARMLKRYQATIWTQDENSCVVYGMPMAVKRAQLSDLELPLSEIGARLANEVV